MGKSSCSESPKDTLLRLANENSWVKGNISYLLRTGEVPDYVVMYALERACSLKNVEIVKELLQYISVPSSLAVIKAATPPFWDGQKCFHLLESKVSDWRDLSKKAELSGKNLFLVNLLIDRLRKKEILENLRKNVDAL